MYTNNEALNTALTVFVPITGIFLAIVSLLQGRTIKKLRNAFDISILAFTNLETASNKLQADVTLTLSQVALLRKQVGDLNEENRELINQLQSQTEATDTAKRNFQALTTKLEAKETEYNEMKAQTVKSVDALIDTIRKNKLTIGKHETTIQNLQNSLTAYSVSSSDTSEDDKVVDSTMEKEESLEYYL